jgi:hypothetical protein
MKSTPFIVSGDKPQEWEMAVDGTKTMEKKLKEVSV